MHMFAIIRWDRLNRNNGHFSSNNYRTAFTSSFSSAMCLIKTDGIGDEDRTIGMGALIVLNALCYKQYEGEISFGKVRDNVRCHF